jgi:heme/copper-type cytochrome/quinol oxidase subunit 3
VDKNKLGVGLFLASEAVFFTVLILAFIYFRGNWIHVSGPNPAGHLHPVVTGMYSLALFASSGTTLLAERGARRGNRTLFRLGLLATIILGVVFLSGQGREYAELIGSNVTISRNLFGTTFFTLTGFHGLHVIAGLVTLSIFLGVSLAAEKKGRPAPSMGAVALYWHFVDAVWVVIFSIVYIWTALL